MPSRSCLICTSHVSYYYKKKKGQPNAITYQRAGVSLMKIDKCSESASTTFNCVNRKDEDVLCTSHVSYYYNIKNGQPNAITYQSAGVSLMKIHQKCIHKIGENSALFPIEDEISQTFTSTLDQYNVNN